MYCGGGGALSGGCKGGADPFQPPSYTSVTGSCEAVVPCVNGGTTARPATRSELKWLGPA